MPYSPVYTVVVWISATQHSNMPSLLMKPAALTNIPNHTLITQILLNNTFILIHINGDAQSVSNNRLIWTTKYAHQSFKLLLNVWAI